MHIRITAENFKTSLLETISLDKKSSIVERHNSTSIENLAQAEIESHFSQIINETPLVNLANDYYQVAFEEIPYVFDGEFIGQMSSDVPDLSKHVKFDKIK